MNTNWLRINQLDICLKQWQNVANKYSRPQNGWVKTIREALNMPVEQLAQRLGLSRSRINQLENSEVNDAITLRTLKETASAMGCELVYAIVPKNNDSLESIIRARINKIAEERVGNVAHSMLLEAQSVDSLTLNRQKEELVKSLLVSWNKKIWRSTDFERPADKLNKSSYPEYMHKKLIELLKKKK